jgi:hypothetical protein
MLENLINLIRENAGDAIINNPAIPNERNDEAVQEAGGSIIDTLKGALAGGNSGGLMDMFTNGRADNDNPLVQQASGNLVERLAAKFGINPQQAAGIAASLIPMVMNKFARRTADPNDNGFDLQDILGKLGGGGGGNAGGLMDKVKGMFGS